MGQEILFIGCGLLAGLLSGLLGLGGGLILTPLLSILFLREGLASSDAVVSAAATTQAASAVSLSLNLILRSRSFEPVSRPIALALMSLGAFSSFLAPQLFGKPTAAEIHIAFVTACLVGAALQGLVLIRPNWRSANAHPVVLLATSCFSCAVGSLAGMGGGVLFLPSAQLLGFKLHESITYAGYLALASLWLGSIGYALTGVDSGAGLFGPIRPLAAGLVIVASIPGLWVGVWLAKRHSPKALRISALTLMAGIGLLVALRS
jgi:uncharacterized membrane protein YfcA